MRESKDMEETIQKASILVEALPYIQSFRDKIVVIKCGGDSAIEETFLDIVFMETVGMKPVIVHGGGKAISQNMQRAGIQPRFVSGLRFTDEQTMKIVEQTLVEEINQKIVENIRRFGGKTQGLSAKQIMRVKKHLVKTKDQSSSNEKLVDIGLVGKVEDIDPKPVQALCDRDVIPVIAPVGTDERGQSYNVNADTVAGELAIALRAEKLIFLTDVLGIMKTPGDSSSLFSTLQVDSIEKLIEEGVISGGMIPKARAALKAVRAGVHKTHIISGKITHSLLLEIFTDKGIGTQIVE